MLSRFMGRLISWFKRITGLCSNSSKGRLRLPAYKEAHPKEGWKDRLSLHPDYRSLCLWLAVRKDQEYLRLLRCKQEDLIEIRAKMDLLESLHNELAREITGKENRFED